ncbi:ribosomal maturation YjgA family protein [Phytomonospora endophytica]|uniref:DUF2809 domain-containing protein n=1 Tax=Phytomonospora endophytica TaxID=714109 RepID=A0A841FYR3_9ACTN|nr:DUF2809 domain-containing protein [Phytomonospora endophytica]MBB6037579.1 hypothetical protein [Phytomonospora endophytica]GIG67895.1 membrane protein [Phytomonospora endophytica]
MRIRLPYAVAAVVTVALGLGLRTTMDGAVAKYGGDALYTLLVFWLVLVLAPRTRGLVAGAIACGLSWAVEFFQLTPIPAELSGNPLARLVLGSTFNAPDLFWYAVGAALGVAILAALRRAQDRTTVAADT